MNLARRKFEDLLQDGTTRVFKWEVSHGYTWVRRIEERIPFETMLHTFMAELM